MRLEFYNLLKGGEILKLSEEMIMYRAKNNLSQSELSKMCGVNVMTINHIERGIQQPTLLTETKIRLVINEQEEK